MSYFNVLTFKLILKIFLLEHSLFLKNFIQSIEFILEGGKNIVEENIILDIFEFKEDTFNFRNEELEKVRNNCSHELFTFIYDNINPKQQDKLLDLIDNFLNANDEYIYYEKKMFYKEGFIDGMCLMMNYFNK